MLINNPTHQTNYYAFSSLNCSLQALMNHLPTLLQLIEHQSIMIRIRSSLIKPRELSQLFTESKNLPIRWVMSHLDWISLPAFKNSQINFHLNRHQLMTVSAAFIKDLKNQGVQFGASCHNVDEICKAHQLDCNWLTLSPVLPTATHPGAPTLGWQHTAQLIEQCKLPVYLLGGLSLHQLPQAQQIRAQGIAGIRCFQMP